MKRIGLRLISAIITLCMILTAIVTVFPVTAFAAEGVDVKAYGVGNVRVVRLTQGGVAQRVKVNAPFSGLLSFLSGISEKPS